MQQLESAAEAEPPPSAARTFSQSPRQSSPERRQRRPSPAPAAPSPSRGGSLSTAEQRRRRSSVEPAGSPSGGGGRSPKRRTRRASTRPARTAARSAAVSGPASASKGAEGPGAGSEGTAVVVARRGRCCRCCMGAAMVPVRVGSTVEQRGLDPPASSLGPGLREAPPAVPPVPSGRWLGLEARTRFGAAASALEPRARLAAVATALEPCRGTRTEESKEVRRCLDPAKLVSGVGTCLRGVRITSTAFRCPAPLPAPAPAIPPRLSPLLLGLRAPGGGPPQRLGTLARRVWTACAANPDITMPCTQRRGQRTKQNV
mmetsp:Transcript_86062/g.238442  ORF Transcript_86062/g.238442 Transcript_86062/m.238442 type:complete len:316 (-) Transcript_86062:46-993(-)